MTKEELAKKLKECDSEGTEEGHIAADALLLEYIDDPDVSNAFLTLFKWYS